MPFLVTHIDIQNYRSIAKTPANHKQLGLPLKDYTVLIGRNNTGKSNLLSAIQLLFEGTAKDLREDDFHGQGHTKASEISITATLVGIGGYLSLLAKEHRAKIEACVEDDSIKIRRTAKRGKGLDKIQIWQPQKKDFGLPTGIDAALKQMLPEIIFIEAFKDPTAEAVGKSTATLGKMLSRIVKSVETAVLSDLEKAFEKAEPKLNVIEKDGKATDRRVKDIQSIEGLIKQHLADVFERAEVRLEFSFPGISTLFGSVTVKTRDHSEAVWTPPGWQGQGFQRMLYFALVRTLADIIRRGGKAVTRPFLLLFEEPEAFLHPSLQRSISDALEDITTQNQVIIATHSPMVVTPSRLENIVFTRMENHTRFCLPDLGGAEPSDKHLGRLLTLTNSAEFLFADRVLVVEGPSDRSIFEAVWSRRKQLDLPECHLAVLDCGSKDVMPRWCSILHNMGIRSHAVADLDLLWRGAGNLLKDDEILSKFCQQFWDAAERAGIVETEDERRKIKDGQKKQAFAVIEQEFKEEKVKLRTKLKEQHDVWVLDRGEIEDYVGLSQRTKGQYTRVNQEIRAGKIKPHDELLDILKWVASM